MSGDNERPSTTTVRLTPAQMRDVTAAGWVPGGQALDQWLVDSAMRLHLCRRALMAEGYFAKGEIGPDIAPRITELISALRRT